ncbi:predicted protein [Sclerotinia sclerotiorum 1980 UF-70]|uniref:Uncharacterized protein n=1 Tax=Sclerotinia sclerotiorum (strain ATCC 18683 / 1980 / Ss-1) TaxID=665079 RepID=A7EAK9_SCLS1|nr:predicted protein [Sclerotinia sclerotiorum 1980 UF-70]EDN99487.1 predicted protein [Sclerotinia sclerotiorum 1980 UF-70]
MDNECGPSFGMRRMMGIIALMIVIVSSVDDHNIKPIFSPKIDVRIHSIEREDAKTHLRHDQHLFILHIQVLKYDPWQSRKNKVWASGASEIADIHS